MIARLAAVGLAVVLGTVGWAWVGEASDAAREARQVAEEATRRATVASLAADSAWAAYTDRGDSLTVLADSLNRVEAAARRDVARARGRVDTVVAMVPDTGAVPRAIHDSVVDSFDRLVLDLDAQVEAATASASLWRSRWAAADSGWTAEREANARLAEAVDRWRSVASPSWWDRARRDAGLLVGAAAVAVIGWEVVR